MATHSHSSVYSYMQEEDGCFNCVPGLDFFFLIFLFLLNFFQTLTCTFPLVLIDVNQIYFFSLFGVGKIVDHTTCC